METCGYNLAFDLGATSWRAILSHHRDGPAELEEVYRSDNLPIQTKQGMFWNIEKIFSEMKHILRRLADQGILLDSIGIDSWSVDYALLDERGRLLENPRCYRDPRNEGMLDHLRSITNINDLFTRTGTMAEDITTLCQLLAAKRDTPQLLASAHRLLFIPDVLRYWLCGQCATDFTLASTSQLYHIAEKCWDYQLLDQLNLPGKILPPIGHGCSVLGGLTDSVQHETGQPAVPVTIGASHDTAAAFFAANADKDSVVISSGTWSVLGVNLEAPLSGKNINPLEFGYEGNVDGTVRLIQNVPGMYLLEQCRREWQSRGQTQTYSQLISAARDCEHFSTRIDPFCSAFVEPSSMTEAIVHYCHQSEQPSPRRPEEFARAIFGGLARSYAKAIDQLRVLTGQPLNTLVMVGGGSQNDLLNEMTGDAACLSVVRGPVEASTAGNIQCQQQALAH